MSVLIYLCHPVWVVCYDSILVVELVMDYLIIIGFSYYFNYLHKSHDALASILIRVCHPIILSICHMRCIVALFVTWGNIAICTNMDELLFTRLASLIFI